MSKRKEHTFQFTAKQIADGAAAEAKYHDARAAWWNGEYEKACVEAEKSGVKITHFEVSGGKRAQMTLDPTLQRRIEESAHKRSDHQQKADRYKIEAASYASQPETLKYDLDNDDVVYFRLAGGLRDDEKPATFV
jgi:hypothetical protein